MVRFIIIDMPRLRFYSEKFTFQYGQIYYAGTIYEKSRIRKIYIPIWLDLLFGELVDLIKDLQDLHSNMVRFIMSADL